MRIVIDLQACQSGSRYRGIGRYAMALTEAIIRVAPQHEIILVLSGLFPSTIEPLITHFSSQLSPENIRIWYAHPPLNTFNEPDNNRVQIATKIREAFLQSLSPDIVLLTSLFESCNENTITSINQYFNVPTAVILYDLIPFIYADIYLQDPTAKSHYLKQVHQLQQAQLILAISDSAKQEVQSTQLPIPMEKVFNISGSAEPFFKKLSLSPNTIQNIRSRYGLHQDFLMYTGGIDFRKNIDGLIQSFAALPDTLRQTHQLAIVCKVGERDRKRFEAIAHQLNVSNQIIITGFVSDEDLVILYNLCKAFVFPSKHEGFGLPILEAMQCGAPVITSNTSSMPEVHGFPEGQFDPNQIDSIRHAIEQVLTDQPFREKLIHHASTQVKNFSWEQSAAKAIAAIEQNIKISHSFTASLSTKKQKLCIITSHALSEEIKLLNEYYEIEVYPELKAQKLAQYDRVVYFLKDSKLTCAQLELLSEIPGVIILENFHFSQALAQLEKRTQIPYWTKSLYESHGYQAVAARFHAVELEPHTFNCERTLTKAARGLISTSHSAQQYFKTIEQCYRETEHCPIPLFQSIQQTFHLKPQDPLLIAEALCMNQKSPKQLLVDISSWQSNRVCKKQETSLLKKLLQHPPEGYRVEPIISNVKFPFFKYARQLSLETLDCPRVLKDEIITIHPHDCYFRFSNQKSPSKWISYLQNHGVDFCINEENVATINPSTLAQHLLTLFPKISGKHTLVKDLNNAIG